MLQCNCNTTKGGITVDWNTLKAEYIAGGVSYRELAEKHGVSENTLRRRAAKEKWRQERHKSDTKTAQKIIEIVSDENAEKAVTAASLISKAAMNFLMKIAEESLKIKEGKLDKDITTKYSEYALALSRFKDVLDIKSEKDIEEQQARIDNLRKQAEKDEKKDNKIVIEYNGLEEFSE